MEPTDEQELADASDETSEHSVDSAPSDGESSGHGQYLAPLFVLAFALVGVGYYLGLSEEVDSSVRGDPTKISATAETTSTPDDSGEPDAPRATLGFGPHEKRRYVLMMDQKSTRRYLRGESELLRTKIDLEVAERTDESDDDVLTVYREYLAAELAVQSAGEPVGEDIVAQVEKLLTGVQTETMLQRNGQPVELDWTEVSNPQVRRALLLIRDAHRFTTPRFRRDAINIGETWSYTLETSVENSDRGLVVRGGADVVNKLVDLRIQDGRLVAFVEQELDVNSRGAVELPEGGEAPFDLEGAGSGMLRVDVQSGYVISADITVERVLSIEQGDGQIDQTSELDLELRPVSGKQ